MSAPTISMTYRARGQDGLTEISVTRTGPRSFEFEVRERKAEQGAEYASGNWKMSVETPFNEGE